jgi:hypothetical protein
MHVFLVLVIMQRGVTYTPSFAVFFFRSTVQATFFQCNNYTRRLFNAIIIRDVYSKNYTRRFFKLRVSLRMKMAAIIRLVCFIKTRNHVITVQNLTFQSVNCEYNALFCFAFSKLYKQNFCVILPGSYIYFPCCTSSYINCVLPYRIYACSSKLRSSVSSLRTFGV